MQHQVSRLGGGKLANRGEPRSETKDEHGPWTGTLGFTGSNAPRSPVATDDGDVMRGEEEFETFSRGICRRQSIFRCPADVMAPTVRSSRPCKSAVTLNQPTECMDRVQEAGRCFNLASVPSAGDTARSTGHMPPPPRVLCSSCSSSISSLRQPLPRMVIALIRWDGLRKSFLENDSGDAPISCSMSL